MTRIGLLLLALAFVGPAAARTLDVGPDTPYKLPSEAIAAARGRRHHP